MNNIKEAFKNKKAFIGFLTAGDPTFEASLENIIALAEGGADLIEIGIPFSDPIAEGPVIQAANIRALSSGMTTERVFELAAEVRRRTDVPLVFMTYLNPVYAYGYDAFFARCAEVGVSGIICPDLPFEERDEVSVPANKHGIEVVSLIAPTSEERIRSIAKDAQGFLYIVSSMGVTGERAEIKTDIASIMAAVRESSSIPAAIGFGINTPEQAAEMASLADGVIVGSAIVRIVEEHGKDAPEYIREYVQSMKSAI
jgi:tryptophan synthase alpha chain